MVDWDWGFIGKYVFLSQIVIEFITQKKKNIGIQTMATQHHFGIVYLALGTITTKKVDLLTKM